MRTQVVIGVVCAICVAYVVFTFAFFSENHIVEEEDYDFGEGPIVHRKFNREALDIEFDVMYDKYVEFHNATLAAEKLGTSRGKYVYVKTGTAGGLGNRLRPIVSGFIFALLTNRVCLIEWEFDDKLSNWTDPGFELQRPSWLDLANETKKSLTTVSFEGGGAVVPLFENLTAYYEKYEVVMLQSNNYPSLLFYENQYHKDWMLKHFAYNAYTIVARRLYKLSPFTQKIVDEFKAAHFGEYNIGMHVRYTRPIYDKLPPLNTFWDVAVLLQQQNFPFHKNTTKFFVAADLKSVQDMAKVALGDPVIFVEPFRERYKDSDAEFFAFVDHVLLGECDLLIVTFTSTFGNIAAAWKSIHGVTIYHDGTYGGYLATEPLYWDSASIFRIYELRNMTIPPLLRYQTRSHYKKKRTLKFL